MLIHSVYDKIMTGYTEVISSAVSEVIFRPLLGLAGGILDTISTPIRKAANDSCSAVQDSSRPANIFVVKAAVALFIVFFGYLTLKKTRDLLFKPLNRVRRLGTIGYINHESGDISRKELANLIRQRRKTGKDLPPVYPNGWFRLIDTVELGREEVKQVHALGKNFAVFRGKSGNVSVMDAYCAHMGGSLAAGGRVLGDCIECPFHGWVYNQEGKCVRIPYTDKVPEFAKMKVWPSREVNGVVFVWYHCDDVEPQWEIPEIEAIKNGRFKYRGRVEHHTNTHIQDIPENGSDLAHLSHLHVPSVLCGVNLAEQFDSWFNFADHIFKVKCKGADPDRPHVSCFDMTHHIEFFKRWDLLKLSLYVEQIGPGMVHLRMKLPFGEGVFVQTLTPVGPLHQVLIHSFYTDWKTPMWLGKIYLAFEAIQVDRDVMVWNNKTFSAKPLLVKEDAPIAKYRRWFSQFYSENSPRLKMKEEDTEEW